MWWVVAGGVSVASAADLRAEDVVVVSADEQVADDLYVVARRVVIEGRVDGDAMLVAEEVRIDGVVEGDLAAVARTVKITGTVSDDVRLVGQSLILDADAHVADDVLGVGFGLWVHEDASVARDLAFTGYELLLDGTVGRDVSVAGSAVRVRGEVEGDLTAALSFPDDDASWVDLGQSGPLELLPPGLDLTSDARLGGDLVYHAPEPATVDGTIGGTTEHHQIAFADTEPTPSLAFRALRRMLGLALVGLTLLAVFPTLHGQVVDQVRDRPLRNLGLGVLTGLAGIVLAGTLAFSTLLLAGGLGVATLGGLSGAALLTGLLAEGALLTGFFLLIGWVAHVPVLYVVGDALWNRLDETRKPARGWVLLTALIPFTLLLLVPVVGSLTQAVTAAIGLGALAVLASERLAFRRQAAS